MRLAAGCNTAVFFCLAGGGTALIRVLKALKEWKA
jgi:hypothetical protein